MDHQVTLRVPEAIYERARHIAEQTAQPIEKVLEAQLDQVSGRLDFLPQDEQRELAAFQYLSDDTLFGIVAEQMPPVLNERMVVLGERASRGTITSDEETEQVALVERGNRLMLRKAWAANVLMDRGFAVSLENFAPDDE